MQGFLDASDYYATATQWAQQIKTYFSDAKISLVNTVVRSSDVTNRNRYYDWNHDLAAVDLGDIDAMSRHYYTGPDSSMISMHTIPWRKRSGIDSTLRPGSIR